MPGRRLPTRRGNAVVGGNSPTLQGSLVLSTTSLSYSITEGEYIEYQDVAFVLSNGGPGNLTNPQYSISYSDAEDWLSFASGQSQTGFEYSVRVQAAALPPSTQVATVTFSDANSSNSVQLVITVDVVADSPTIGLSPPTLAMSVLDETGLGGASTVTVSNATGRGTLATPTAGTITGAGAAYIGNVAFTGPAGGPYTMSISPTAVGGTVGGPYQAVIPVQCAGALNSPSNVTVDVTVTTTQTAVIGVTRTLDDVQYTLGDPNPGSPTVAFFNAGTGSFAGVTIQSTGYAGDFTGWATPSISNGVLTVAINAASVLTEGTSTCTVTLADANAVATRTYEVFLRTAQAVLSPLLSIAPSAISFSVTNGQNPQDRTVTIQNVNGSIAALGALSVSVLPGASWCSVASVVNGTATLAFNTSALANGSYTATVQVAASLASNSPQTMQVLLTVVTATAVPMLRYTLPSGLTQNPTTGYIEGLPTGVVDTPPTNWDVAATHSPTTSAMLQTHLNASALAANANGDGNVIIDLDPAILYSGNYTVPAPTTRTGWLIIRSKNHASLTLTRGVRIAEAAEANLGRIETPNTAPALLMENNVAKVWCMGVRFTDLIPNPVYPTYNLVRVQPNTNVLDQSTVPQDIYFDHCWFKGNTRLEGGTFRGIYWTANRSAVMDSHFTDFKVKGFETQCMLIPHSGGFYYVYNCYLEAAGESIMLGGNSIPTQNPAWNPHDFYARQCVFTSRMTWSRWSPTYLGHQFGHKNVFEVKRGVRGLLWGCIFKDGYQEAQAGIQVVLKSTNQNGDNLNSYSDDWQLLHCWGYNLARTFNVISISSNNPLLNPPLIHQSKPSDRTHVLECLWERLNMPGTVQNPNTQGGYLIETANRATNTVIERNTMAFGLGGVDNSAANGSIAVAPMTNIEVIDNIFPQRSYGMKGNSSEGNASFNAYWTNYTVTRNSQYGGGTAGASFYPPGNDFPANVNAIGFVNPTGTTPLDFDFLPSSPFYGNGVEPTRGANVKRVHYATDGVLAGTPVNS